jgi:hypothetical protein
VKLSSLTVVMRTLGALLAVASIGLFTAGQAVAKTRTLRAPGLQSPGNGATVASLPAFTWGGVGGAATYQFEFSANRAFTSGVPGFGNGPTTTQSTAITTDKAIPNGTYYWRVRGVSATDRVGRWSSTRTINKQWNQAPSLISPLGGGVTWPSSPLVLKWNPVAHATQYYVRIATDPALSNLIVGSVSNPVKTQGPVFSYLGVLPPGRYYWAITPVDAEGNQGTRSGVGSFTWSWPSDTSTNVTNQSTDSSVFDPQFSWAPIPGAVGYQVQVNSSPAFPAGSQWCCTDNVLGTSLSPTQFLPNETTLYWRVRGLDSNGDAGDWNYGSPFTETFDQLNPTIQNLTLRSPQGNALAPGTSTQSPLVTWSPVPGASSYEVQITPYTIGCDWTSTELDEYTATTAWTPQLGGRHIGPSTWPGPEGGWAPGPGNYCFRVLARRDDQADGGSTIISDWTELGGFNGDAFAAVAPPSGGTLGLNQTPASAYISPSSAGVTPTVTSTPYFTWQPVTGAGGYYVVVARDACFTDVIDEGFTDTTAWAPRIANKAPYADETSSYYYAVVPANKADGTGVLTDPECSSGSEDSPQAFTKASVPPNPVSPGNGSTVSTEATFHWTSAQGARNYQLQVAGDPSFGSPLIQVTTDSSSYTTETTLPANKTLFWRVRANDATGQGLNWSATWSFTHTLPVPSPSAGNPGLGESIPDFGWSAVNGAVSYDVHVDQADGSTKDWSTYAPDIAPVEWWGTGIWRWQVRANFPGGVSGAYFSPESQYVRLETPPSGAYGTKSGNRIVINWNPDPNAKQYQVQLSATDGFASPIASDTTDNTAWAPQITALAAKSRLYWRVASVDQGSNVGTYATGVFGGAHKVHHKKHKKKHKKKCRHGRTKSGKCKK